jgi:hypothetical protein
MSNFLLVTLLTISAIFGNSSSCPNGQCGTEQIIQQKVVRQQVIKEPVIQQQVVQPQVVYEQPQNLQSYQNLVANQKVVQYDPNYFARLQGYYSVSEPQSNAQLQSTISSLQQQDENLAAEIKRIADLLKELIDLVKSGQPYIPNPNDEPDPDEPPVLDQQVFAIFEDKCSSCHSEQSYDSSGGGFQLVDLSDENAPILFDQSLEDRLEIHDRVLGVGLKERGKSIMPKGGSPLSDKEVELLRLWMIQKSDENKSE